MTRLMKRYNHFVFDIDGTLIDTESTGILSLIRTISELMGKEMPYEEALKYFGIPSSKVAPMLGYPDEERFAALWEERFVEMSGLMKPFDGVGRALATVKEAGRYIGCVTSRNRYEFSKDIHLAKLLEYFDFIVCAEDSERHKPYPDPMLAYMRKAGAGLGHEVSPGECLYIGDTVYDYRCGHDAGCDFALADWRSRGTQDIPAEYHFCDADGIIALL